VNETAARGGRPVAVVAALFVLAAMFVALGLWQVQRLAWKEALIARTDAAMHAPPIGPGDLPRDLATSGYRRVIVTGRFEGQGLTLVTGTSTLGSGYWVMVPLRDEAGHAIYVNRGYVPIGSRAEASRRALPTVPVTVTGLLRLTEPSGTLLRSNHPAEDRWYSRDIAAIAAKRGIIADTRWFLDAQSETPQTPGTPVQDLTIVQFPNNHLGYALTWFALALLCAGGSVVLWRRAP
jgi:surfeit locus 1 family protein